MINRVTLIGRLGKNPEIRYFENGLVFCKFSLATSEYYQKEGEWIETVEWHNIVIWREQAQRAEKMLKVGYLVFVEGKLTYRKWRDAEGRERETTEIVADKYRIMSKTETANAAISDSQPIVGGFINNGQNRENAAATDDLPF